MSLRVFYFAILAVLATITALSLIWEFGLEDLVQPVLGFAHEVEDEAARWEFVVTTVVFTTLALIGPTVVGTRIIRRDRALQEEITRLSQEDHLTGLLNRRQITQLLDNEVRRALRYDATFSVIMMDIDNFKSVNDRFGHQAGDTVLKKIADVIRKGVRATDLIGRWGGEEFIILSPETDVAGSILLAEKMRSLLEANDFGKIGDITASFGVAAFNQSDDCETVIGRADAGLYAAKNGGKNRVEVVQTEGQVKSESGPHVKSRPAL
jgi:diguanylate cyclase (GGDEF)-like protein